MDAVRVLAVVVRYNMPLAESPSLDGLTRALKANAELSEAYKLLVWDNSPQVLADPRLPIPFEYRHTGENLGVAGAYNHAMAYALEHGYRWLLLLDQDSHITAEFLTTLLRHARALVGRAEVAAITPTVWAGTALASPRRQLTRKNIAYPAGECGIAEGEAIAINSGCLMRAEALKEIGGFSETFWLDYSDLYVFHQFFLRGKKVWRAADAVLQHEMSLTDMDRFMSPWRYRNLSYAESAFYDLYKSRLDNWHLTLRLLGRAIRQRKKYKNQEFARISREQFLNRLLRPRRQRLARWAREGELRRKDAATLLQSR